MYYWLFEYTTFAWWWPVSVSSLRLHAQAWKKQVCCLVDITNITKSNFIANRNQQQYWSEAVFLSFTQLIGSIHHGSGHPASFFSSLSNLFRITDVLLILDLHLSFYTPRLNYEKDYRGRIQRPTIISSGPCIRVLVGTFSFVSGLGLGDSAFREPALQYFSLRLPF